LLGRERERTSIERLLDRARSGRGGAVLVTGEPGIGKSTLLWTVAHGARDVRCLWLQGTPAERELAGAGSADLARHLGEPPDRDVVAACLDAARVRPLLLLVDDLDLLDAPSQELVLRVAARAPGARLVVLASATGPVGAVDELPLPPLDEQTARALAGERGVAQAGGNPAVLAALAASPSGVDPELPAELAERLAATVGSPAARAAALLVALEPGLDPASLRFVRPGTALAVRATASASELRRAHAVLAELVPGERGALHLAAATAAPDESVARRIVTAAAGAEDAARMRLLVAAARLTPARARAAARLLDAAGAAARAGDWRNARDLLDELASHPAADQDEVARAQLDLAGQAGWRRAATAEAVAATERAARRTGDPQPLLAALVHEHVARRDASAASEAAEQLRRAGSPADRPAAAHLALGWASLLAGQPADAIASAARAAADLPDEAASLLVTAGEAEGAAAAIDAAATPHVDALARRHLVLAEIALARGELDAAARESDAANRVAGDVADARLRADCAAAVALVLAQRDPTRARPAAAHALGLALAADLPAPAARARHALGLARLAAGDAAGAAAPLAEAAPLVPAGADLAEALALAGREVPLEHLTARVAGLLAAESDYDEAFAPGLAASTSLERERTRLRYGERLLRSGRRREAREALRQAGAGLGATGATAWAALAARRLRQPRPRGDGLTGRERQIALLVADGASTADAAARLVLSVRTVEYHLANAYRKLGVRSRVELVARLGGGA
jgi:DNA-binding CsgD family transcriptional regulator